MNRTTLGGGLAAAVVAAGLLASSPVAAATKDVEATEDKVFSPRALTSSVAGSVHWFGTPGGSEEHSVHQGLGLFDSGEPQTGLDFTRTFSAGTFAYYCEKHGTPTSGMRGTVTVSPKVLSAPAGLDFTVRWATSTTDTGDRFDVMYRVGSGAWATWRNNTRARSLVFGQDGGPVPVALGESYSFKVRSGQGTGARQSGFSPVKSFLAS
jgi:plastocyanin